ncbi:hypothetical protein QBC38DRAFT_100182 [Podospora fimiseda]|uniref:Extracellular membrane protein CFEM domain-containing protein n=1 Tax=Podospora fimiseda TaxID=252190 RepID=A0AAN6YMU6_9PEZI|nr:hypothetical protein QBC38DRAFT_100182 [Podospora fimiseda]
MFLHNRLLGIFALFILLFGLPASTVCVWPKGDAADEALGECGTKAPLLCCAPGDICLSNGLCSGPAKEFYRGGCTSTTHCAGFCLEGHNDTIAVVSPCLEPKASIEQEWVCGAVGACRDKKAEVFTLVDVMTPVATVPKSQPTLLPPVHPPPVEISSVKPSSTQPPISKTSSAQGPPTAFSNPPPPTSSTLPRPKNTEQPLPPPGPPDQDPTSFSGQIPTSSPDQQSTPIELSTPSSEASPIPPQNNSSSGIYIGVGVGIGASVMIAASILIYCFARKRHNRRFTGPVRAETPPPLDFDEDLDFAQAFREDSKSDTVAFSVLTTITNNTAYVRSPPMERIYSPYRPGTPGLMSKGGVGAEDGVSGVNRVYSQRRWGEGKEGMYEMA